MNKIEKMILAGGCFWGVEAFFAKFKGIKATRVGYMDGEKDNPTYEEVCSNSKHSEVVEVTFDPSEISFVEVLKYFFLIIDPTSLNKQGNDVGVQYRTAIYYLDDKQKQIALDFIAKKQKDYDQPIVVEVTAASTFWEAEKYHQQYLAKNPTGYCHLNLPQLFRNIDQEKIKK